MGSKLKKKENIGYDGEHSTRFDTKRVMQMNNEHMFIKEYSVHLAPPVIMKRFKKYTRKLSETIEGPTFGVNQRYPKRRKIEHYQENFIKSDYMRPLNVQYFSRNSINMYRKLRFKSTIYNIQRFKTTLQFSKLNPDIILDFIKHPSVDKISKVLDLMYTESIQFKKHTFGIICKEQRKKMSIDFKKYLFELCYQKFCELWMHKTPKIPSLSSKQCKRFVRILLRHARCRSTICNMSLKKLILYNGGLTGYPKKPHLVLCINIICSFFNTILRKCFRMISMGYKKKANCKGYKKEITSIKLYHKGTTKRKDFLEIIDEYKQLMNVNRLSRYQVADIKHAYENILEPGKCIDKADLEKCAYENYDFNRFQDATKINHTIISEDLNTNNNDDFDFDDIDRTPASVLKLLYDTPTPEIDDCFKADNFPKHDLKFFKDIQSHFFSNRKNNKHNMETTKDNSKNKPIEEIEKEIYTPCTSNEDHNIENKTLTHSSREVKPFINCLEQNRTAIVDQDMDLPTRDLEGTTAINTIEEKNNSTPESVLKLLYNTPTPEIDDCFKADNFPKHDLKFFKDVQSHFFSNRKNNKYNTEIAKDNSKNRSIEAIEKEIHTPCTSNEDVNIKNETTRHSLRELKPFIECLEQRRTVIFDQDMDISTGNLERTTATSYFEEGTCSKYLEPERATNHLKMQCISLDSCSESSERFDYILSTHPIKLNKLEKRTLSIIMFSDARQYKINWKRYSPCSRTRLFQIIVYFGSFKMTLYNNLYLDSRNLKERSIICDMIDIDKLLRSIQAETCLQQKGYTTFTEMEQFLIWPLGKVIVNNMIPLRSPTVNILFSFVKNIITKICEKVKYFLQKSGHMIVLTKESLFENLSKVSVDNKNKLLLKYAHAHDKPSCSANNNAPGSSKSKHFRVKNTGFCIKKNSSNEEIFNSMVKILKSDDCIHKFWKECNNSNGFISKLLKAGVTLPIKESNTGHGSKFVEVYVEWFCEEYLQDNKFYKLAVSIFKNIFLYVDTTSRCTDIEVETAIDNALMILYDQPCFAKAYESYLNTKYPKCLSSLKHNSTNNTKNRSDFKRVNIRDIEKLQIKPNVNVQMDPIDTNDVGMSLVTCNLSTSNELDLLNNVTVNNLITPHTQSSNEDFKSDFIPDFKDLMNENHEITSNGLFGNIDNFGENNLYDGSVTNDLDLMDIDVPNYNNQNFNEDHPFDDDISFNYNDFISCENYLPNNILESNSEFQQSKNMEELPLISSLDQFINYGVSDEELNLQFQQDKNTEEVSMMSSSELVHFDVNDQIDLNDLNMAVDDEYGFYNAGVLLPPYN